MHIPYHGEDEDEAVAVKSSNRTVMSFALAALLSFVTQYGVAHEVKVQKASYVNQIEETVIRAVDLSALKAVDSGAFKVGLSETVLIHRYDAKTDSWKYIGTDVKAQRKKR